MPRKRTSANKAGESTEQEQDSQPAARRSSARLAAAVQHAKEVDKEEKHSSPAKSPAKTPRRRASKKAMEEMAKITSEENEQVSGDEQQQSGTGHDAVDAAGPSSSTGENGTGQQDDEGEPAPKRAKQDKIEEEEEEEKKNNSINDDKEAAAAGDFDVVQSSDVPAPHSAEVTAAVAAQGEDGALLVGFVQVAKDELPPQDSHEVLQVTTHLDKAVASAAHNKMETENGTAEGDEEEEDAAPAEKQSPVEPTTNDAAAASVGNQ